MSRAAENLLRYLAQRFVGQNEAREIERDASAAEEGAEIESNKRRVVRTQLDNAIDMASAFQAGLVRADRAREAGQTSIDLDDRDPDDDAIASALIHFLVRTDLATSLSRETEPEHYVYSISIDWPALETVADAAEVDLNGLLTSDD